MLPYCCVCKKNLKNKSSIYFGFDNNYCSEYCRNEFLKIVKKNDPRMLEPYKWKELSKKNTYSNLENIENNLKNLDLIKREEKEEEYIIPIKDPPTFDKKLLSNDKINIKENDISLNNKLRLYDSEYQANKKEYSKKNKKSICTYSTIKYLLNIILIYK